MLNALAEHGLRRPRRILMAALVTFAVAAVLGGPVAGQLDSANGFEDPGSSSVAAQQAIEDASGLEASPGLIAVVDTPGGAAGAEGSGASPRSLRSCTAFRAWPSCARWPARRARARGGGRDVGAGHRDARGIGRRGRRRRPRDASPRAHARRDARRLRGRRRADRRSGQQRSGPRRDVRLPAPGAAGLLLLPRRPRRGASADGRAADHRVLVPGHPAHRRRVRAVGLLAERDLRPRPGSGHRLRPVPRVALPRGAERRARRARCVRIATATAGRTVVFSALTVAAAMLSLVVFPQQFLKSIGIGGAVVALVAASVALLILPRCSRRWVGG